MQNIFDDLQQINHKPKPYEYYTTPELWCDPYISKQMLAFHLKEDEVLASRTKAFIDRSANWILNHFNITHDSRIVDFGCGPGLYTSRFAKRSHFVTGIDFSETSINYAKEQAKHHNQKIEYILQDYLTYETDKKFDLITMIYCDFCALNQKQRKLLLGKFHDRLNDHGKIFMDVSSYAQYDARKENSLFEYSEANGFWSPDPYYLFQHHFKYEKERLLLDKFIIIEEARVRESYNWLQCYTIKTITEELQKSGFKVTEHYANVAGDQYTDTATEIAIVAEKS